MKKITIILLLLVDGILANAQDIIDTIINQGGDRYYRVHLPQNMPPTQPVPLVIAMHGFSADMSFAANYGFSPVSDTANFIAVYPQGDNVFGFASGWRIGTAFDGNKSDVQFISDLIDTLQSKYLIDSTRIYATGFSMGGFMSHILGCELSNRIAAIGAHSGTASSATLAACNPGRKVPVIHFHGTNDAVINHQGGNFNGFLQFVSAQDVINHWVSIDSCTGTIDSTRLPDVGTDGANITVDRWVYNGCKDSTEVELYLVNNFNHDFAVAPRNDVSAAAVMWQFFSRHRLPTNITDSTMTSIYSETLASRTSYNDALVSVYPNPTYGKLNVSVAHIQSFTLKIYDLSGALLFDRQGIESGIANLDLCAAPGMYILQISDDNTGYMITNRTLIVE